MKLVHFIPSKKGRFFKSVIIHPESEAFLSATGITDIDIINAIDGILVPGLKDIGWSKFKAVYPFVGGTADTHKYNLIDPRDLDAAYRITWFGGVTHSANGVQGNRTNGYAVTHLFRNNFNLDGQGLFAYSRTNSAQNIYDMGTSNNSLNAGTYLIARWSDGVSYNRNETGVSMTATLGRSDGLVGQFRINNSNIIISRNTTKNTVSGARTQSGDSVYPFVIMARNIEGQITNFSDRQYAAFYFTDQLTSADYDNLESVNLTFQTALGRAV